LYVKSLSDDEIEAINSFVKGPFCHNVVGTIRFGIEPDVCHLSWELGGKHNVNGFSAPFTQRIKSPRTTILVFRSGSGVITGCRAPEYALATAYQYADLLRNRGYRGCRPIAFQIFNTQSTIRMGYTIDLPKLSLALPEASYRTKTIGCLRYKYRQPDLRATYLIYSTGRVVICGPCERETLMRAFHKIVPILAHYKVRFITDEAMMEEKKSHEREHKRQKAVKKRDHKEDRTRAKMISNHNSGRSTKLQPADLLSFKKIAEFRISEKCVSHRKKTKKRKKECCQHLVEARYEGTDFFISLYKLDAPIITLLLLNNHKALPKHFESWREDAMEILTEFQVKYEAS
jgi:TATA-box binding protein (TBP) (component of TFIID and TFIIIB)